jgi:beta-glucosidase
MPVRQLRGFDKETLKAGASKTVSFALRNKDLAYYSVVLGGWTIPEGDFTVSVGSSSRKLPLTGKISV